MLHEHLCAPRQKGRSARTRTWSKPSGIGGDSGVVWSRPFALDVASCHEMTIGFELVAQASKGNDAFVVGLLERLETAENISRLTKSQTKIGPVERDIREATTARRAEYCARSHSGSA